MAITLVERQKIYDAVHRHPEMRIIEKTCNCPGAKEMHHYDYQKPFNVYALCRNCHLKEHATIKGTRPQKRQNRIKKPINITIDEGQLAALRRIAKEQISTISGLIREALKDLISRKDRNDS